MDKFIVVAGNIGAGKSTFGAAVSERLASHLFRAGTITLPKDFYSDMRSGRFIPSFTS